MNLREIYANTYEPQRTELLKRVAYHWPSNARPSQVPEGPDRYHVIVGGRGSGKTRAGAEWIREKAREPNQRLLLVARTAMEVRNVIVEGESGILSVSPDSERPKYNPSTRLLTWPNGTQGFCMSWDEPDSLRGLQVHHAWLDEPGKKLSYLRPGAVDSFSNADMAARLTHDSQMLITGTSYTGDSPLWDAILEATRDGYVFRSSTLKVYHMATLDNMANLHPKWTQMVMDKFSGTSRASQELFGQL